MSLILNQRLLVKNTVVILQDLFPIFEQKEMNLQVKFWTAEEDVDK